MSKEAGSSFQLRPYEPERDAQAVEDIVRTVWRGAGYEAMEEAYGIIGGQPWQTWLWRSVEDYLKADDHVVFVAERGDEVVGFCSWELDHERRRGTVGYNGVALTAQGQGLGKYMLDFVLDQLRQAGMIHAGVIVADNEEHAPARHLYEKAGFRKLSGHHYLVQKL